MECEHESGWLSNKDYLKQFYAKALKERIPLSGTIELTRRCTFNCVHCYLGDKESKDRSSEGELDTKQWMHIIDEIVEAGCLYLLITGGDPLVRKDFPEIYTYAKQKGLIVTVFTNGEPVSDDIIELFKALPPRAVEITIYGASEETYKKITGATGAYKRCIEAVRKILDNGIYLRLKTVLMSYNLQEIKKISALAKKLDIKYRFDPVIFAGLNGNKDPLKFRVPPDVAVKEEIEDQEICKNWIDYFKKHISSGYSDHLYICGAGKTSFGIDSQGNVSPCILMQEPKINVRENKFLTCWNRGFSVIQSKKVDETFECKACKMKALCGYCPPSFKAETGSERKKSLYLCDIGKDRYKHYSPLIEV